MSRFLWIQLEIFHWLFTNCLRLFKARFWGALICHWVHMWPVAFTFEKPLDFVLSPDQLVLFSAYQYEWSLFLFQHSVPYHESNCSGPHHRFISEPAWHSRESKFGRLQDRRTSIIFCFILPTSLVLLNSWYAHCQLIIWNSANVRIPYLGDSLAGCAFYRNFFYQKRKYFTLKMLMIVEASFSAAVLLMQSTVSKFTPQGKYKDTKSIFKLSVLAYQQNYTSLPWDFTKQAHHRRLKLS